MDKQERNKIIVTLHEKLIKIIGVSGKQAINHYFNKIDKDDIYNCKSIYNLSNNKLAEKFFILYRLYYYTENKNRLDNLQYNLAYDVSLVLSKGLYHKIISELNDQETARFKVILKAFKIFFIKYYSDINITIDQLYITVMELIRVHLSNFKYNQLEKLIKKQINKSNKDKKIKTNYKEFFINTVCISLNNFSNENNNICDILSFFGRLETLNNDYAYPYIIAFTHEYKKEIDKIIDTNINYYVLYCINENILNFLIDDINKF